METRTPASLHIQPKQSAPSQDPFLKSWEELKTYRGLDPNKKRGISRSFSKFAGPFNSDDKDYVNPQGEHAQSKQVTGNENFTGYGVFDVITPPYDLYQLGSLYDANYTNHAAVDAKSLNAVGNGYKFEITLKARQRMFDKVNQEAIDKLNKKIARTKIEAQDWLESLNDVDTFTQTMRKVVTDLEATGNGYLEIGRTVNGDIGYLGHVPSTTMRVRRLRDGFVQVIGQRVVFFRNFQGDEPNPLGNDPRPNEILHFKRYSPLNGYYGVPDSVSAMSSIVGDQLAEQYNIDYFDNKAVPRYIITTKGSPLSMESEDRLYRFLETGLKGQNHRTLYVPLPPDTQESKSEFKMEPVENRVQEASFDSYRRSNRDNILMAHQVPLSKLGSPDAASVAAALVQDRTFRDQVCRPLQDLLAKGINRIIKEKSDVIEIAFEEMNIVDEVQQSTILKTYSEIGAILPSEVRTQLGLPAIAGLDDKIAEQNATGARENARVQQASDGPNAIQGRNPKGTGAKEDGNNV